MKPYIFIGLILLLVFNLTAEDNLKNPWKAGLLSLAIPGGGQLYNNAWFKFGTFAAAEGVFAGFAIYNHNKSEDYYSKYKQTLNEKYYDKYNDYYYKKQSNLWWLGITVFISTLDAYVDAHLYNFEMKKKKIHLMFDGEIISLRYNF